AELNVGEMDSLIIADGGGVPFVNYTALAPVLANASSVSGSAPRWLAKGQVFAAAGSPLLSPSSDGSGSGRGSNATAADPVATTNLIVVDTGRERSIGIGRAWPYREIGYAEAQLYRPALDYIGVRPNVGARATMFIDLQQLLLQQGVTGIDTPFTI